MVRPEQPEVSVRAQSAGETGTAAGTTLGGRVEQCRYDGHDAVLHIRREQPAGSELLLARVHGEQALSVGTLCRWPPMAPSRRLSSGATSFSSLGFALYLAA